MGFNFMLSSHSRCRVVFFQFPPQISLKHNVPKETKDKGERERVGLMSKLNGLYPFSRPANLQLKLHNRGIIATSAFYNVPCDSGSTIICCVCVRICAAPSAQGMVREGLLCTVIRFMALVSI